MTATALIPTHYPDRVSARNAAGHDAGRIHLAARETLRDGTTTRYHLTACGLTIGQYGTVAHDIGPTCKRCKAAY